jgi:hypothetical protein
VSAGTNALLVAEGTANQISRNITINDDNADVNLGNGDPDLTINTDANETSLLITNSSNVARTSNLVKIEENNGANLAGDDPAVWVDLWTPFGLRVDTEGEGSDATVPSVQFTSGNESAGRIGLGLVMEDAAPAAGIASTALYIEAGAGSLGFAGRANTTADISSNFTAVEMDAGKIVLSDINGVTTGGGNFSLAAYGGFSVIQVDAGGAGTLTALPSDADNGQMLYIINTSGGAITCALWGGTADIANNNMAVLIYMNGTWYRSN